MNAQPLSAKAAQLRKVLAEPIAYRDVQSALVTDADPPEEMRFPFSCGLTLCVARAIDFACEWTQVLAFGPGHAPVTVSHVLKHLHVMGFNPKIPVRKVFVDDDGLLNLIFHPVEGESWCVEPPAPPAKSPSAQGVN